MENGSSGSDNESLDEGYNGKNEGSSVIPMVTAEVVNGEKSDQTNAEATDSSAKPYVHVVEDGAKVKELADARAKEDLDVPGKDEEKKSQRKYSIPKKRRPSMAKALSKLGHNEETGKVPRGPSIRRGSLHNAVLGVISKRRAQFRKENRALSFRPKNNGPPKKTMVPSGIISPAHCLGY